MQIPSRMVLSEKCREEGKPLKRFTSRHRWLTPGLRDCVEMRFAAVPPDVRKGCALPARVNGIRGYAPTQGRSPGMIRVLPPVGRSRHRTSGGTAANRSFHTVPAPGSVFVDPQCRSPCLRAQVEVTIRSRFDILILAARHNFHRERATYGVPHKIRTGSG